MRINGRPRGHVRCPGPHPAEKPGWRRLDRYLCGGCWAQLPKNVRTLLRAGVPAGASARRWVEASDQIRNGTPLARIEVSE